MSVRPLLARFTIAATLLGSAGMVHAQSGILRFTGMIVEPPCSFQVSVDESGAARLRPSCPRPVAAGLDLVSLEGRATLQTARLTQSAAPIALPGAAPGQGTRLIAIVTYM